MHNAPRALRGVSMVELLVVITILALLMAVLLPAVQSARTAAMRTTCMNNLRQIGLGLVHHHEALGTFPPAGIEWRSPSQPHHRQLAWSAFLLPFIEQQALYDQIDFSLAFDAPENQPAASQVVPIFVCPTAIRTAARQGGRGPSHYGALVGERITSPNSPPKGLMIYDRSLSLKDALDGASHTALVGEDSEWDEGEWINGRNAFDQAFGVNAAPPFENDLRSGHTGGAYLVLADAAVHWMTDDLDLRVLASFFTRAGREPAR